MFWARRLSLLLATLLLAESFWLPRHPRSLALRPLKCAAACEETADDITERVYGPSPPPTPFEFFKLHPAESCSAQPFIASLNAVGRSMLSAVESPHAKHEGWRHMKVASLFASRPPAGLGQLDEAAVKQQIQSRMTGGPCIVIAQDGIAHDMSDLSSMPRGVHIRSIGSSNLEEDARIAQLVGKSFEENEASRNSYGSDALAALNLALLGQVVQICVDDYTHCAQPLRLVWIAAGNATTCPRLLVDMGNHSSLQILHTIIGPHPDVVCGGITQLTLRGNSSVVHTYIQELDSTARHFEVIDAEVHAGARYDVQVIQTGSRLSRMNLHVALLESGANTTISGALIGDTGQCLDLHTSVQHQAVRCSTEQQQRIVLGEGSHGVFKGRIRMPSNAQESSAEQMCKSLLVGQRMKLHVMPTLEISADRVTCSHGAAVSDLDESSLFYLHARGIPRPLARRMLVQSFPLEVLRSSLLSTAATDRLIAKLSLLDAGQETAIAATPTRRLLTL